MLTAYVDDFDLQASKEDSEKHWKGIEKKIDFKEPARYWSQEPTSHLGCQHRIAQAKTADGHTVTTHTAEMKAYLLDLVSKFEVKYNVIVKECKTPYLDATEEKKIVEGSRNDETPRFGNQACSPPMSGLYAARSARPDLNVATLRNARRITRWTIVDDAKLPLHRVHQENGGSWFPV